MAWRAEGGRGARKKGLDRQQKIFGVEKRVFSKCLITIKEIGTETRPEYRIAGRREKPCLEHVERRVHEQVENEHAIVLRAELRQRGGDGGDRGRVGLGVV